MIDLNQDRVRGFEAWALRNGITLTRANAPMGFMNGDRVIAGDYILRESRVCAAAFRAGSRWGAEHEQAKRKQREPDAWIVVSADTGEKRVFLNAMQAFGHIHEDDQVIPCWAEPEGETP